MTAERKSATAPILAAVVLLLVPLGAYVGGYFWLGKKTLLHKSPSFGPPSICREYPQEWMAYAFIPAADLETRIHGGKQVLVSVTP